MKKVFALILVAVMLVTLFSGCSTSGVESSGGAISCDELMINYESYVSIGNLAQLQSLFSYDYFASGMGTTRGTDADGNPIIYNAETLREYNFYGADNFTSNGVWEVIGQNTNEAELAVMAQEMYAFANLDLTITEEYLLSVQYAATPNISSGDDTVHYYEQTLDVVCIDGQYYIQRITLLSETVENGNGGGNSSEPDYYTLEQAKELGGFFVLRDDRFYPLTEGYYSKGGGNISLYCITPISDTLPCIGEDDQLVLFTDEVTQTIDVTETLDEGYTTPIWLDVPYFEDCLCISQLMFYSNRQPKIEAEFTVEEWDEIYSLYENYNDADELVLYSISGNTEFGLDDLINADGDGYLIPCNEREVVTLGYLLGSSYCEVSIPAVARCWNTQRHGNSDAEHEIRVEVTPYGYFVIPVNDLASGVYNVTPPGFTNIYGSYASYYYLFEIQ